MVIYSDFSTTNKAFIKPFLAMQRVYRKTAFFRSRYREEDTGFVLVIWIWSLVYAASAENISNTVMMDKGNQFHLATKNACASRGFTVQTSTRRTNHVMSRSQQWSFSPRLWVRTICFTIQHFSMFPRGTAVVFKHLVTQLVVVSLWTNA